jgi:hypothetical protein
VFLVIYNLCSNKGLTRYERRICRRAKVTNPQQQAAVKILLEQLTLLVGPIEFGTIELVFHQGKLVQLSKNEKLRVE